MSGRLLFVWKIVPLGWRNEVQVALCEPLPRGRFDLLFKDDLVIRGKVPQLADVLAADREAGEVLLWQKFRWTLRHLRRREGGINTVVVTGRDRIDLVIVALRAAQRHRKEGLPDAMDNIVQVRLASHALRHHRGTPRTHAQESRRHKHLRIARPQLVSGNLFDHEAVVRLVRVERPDHVIAIAPCIGALVVVRIASRIGVPHDVEPVPTPLLAVRGTGEEAVDKPLPRSGAGALKIFTSLAGRRRQPCQSVMHASQQGQLGRGHGWLDPCLGELRSMEGVDGIANRRGRHSRLSDRLKGPNVVRFVESLRPRLGLASARGYAHPA